MHGVAEPHGTAGACLSGCAGGRSGGRGALPSRVPVAGGPCPQVSLGTCGGFKGEQAASEDGGGSGVRGCKGGDLHIASGLRRVFSGRIMVCPPETPGPCWNQPHNISFPSQSDVLENNVFPRQRRVPDDGEGSQGLAGCRLMFHGHPGPPSPAPFWGGDGMAASPGCPCPHLHPLPHAWPT